ncbi:hypothetical protein GCM10010911_52600 [Paenibacillus nasutitermitis]|uniref:Uncharacterized protein n=1 Tax=Paenibacillus nasutitermitis TaxID=1652958 RepID=A0A916ZD05_9BACL|nr:hypothetical protein GCM10010911_52600 [Paenibacillus nasutitermitis]
MLHTARQTDNLLMIVSGTREQLINEKKIAAPFEGTAIFFVCVKRIEASASMYIHFSFLLL